MVRDAELRPAPNKKQNRYRHIGRFSRPVLLVRFIRSGSAPNSRHRSRERMRSEVCGTFPLQRGGRSAETALVRIAAPGGPPRGRADLRSAGDRRSRTGAPLGAPPRRFLSSGHASRQTTFDRDLTSASSWRGARSGAQVGSEGLPGPGVRNLCAGAAPCSSSKTPPQDALIEQDEDISAYSRSYVNRIFLKK